MSLYHSHDKKFRELRESWKKIQEDEYDDYKAALAAEKGTKITRNDEYDDYKAALAAEAAEENPGLEGPFKMHNGKTYYYDPREGKYYDHTSDTYVDSSSEEFYQLTGMKRVGESIADSQMREDTDPRGSDRSIDGVRKQVEEFIHANARQIAQLVATGETTRVDGRKVPSYVAMINNFLSQRGG